MTNPPTVGRMRTTIEHDEQEQEEEDRSPERLQERSRPRSGRTSATPRVAGQLLRTAGARCDIDAQDGGLDRSRGRDRLLLPRDSRVHARLATGVVATIGGGRLPGTDVP